MRWRLKKQPNTHTYTKNNNNNNNVTQTYDTSVINIYKQKKKQPSSNIKLSWLPEMKEEIFRTVPTAVSASEGKKRKKRRVLHTTFKSVNQNAAHTRGINRPRFLLPASMTVMSEWCSSNSVSPLVNCNANVNGEGEESFARERGPYS